MIVSINQPAYLPWLGYFDRICKSDIHVVLDHVQFEKNSFINRNRIRTSDGNLLLTVPVKTKGKFGDLSINRLEMANELWKKKHLKTLKQFYLKSAFYDELIFDLEDLFSHDFGFDFLRMLNTFQKFFLQKLRIETKILFSSDLKINSHKGDLVLEICKSLNAKKYISGPYGRVYLNESQFSKANIHLEYHDYKHPKYNQCFKGFEENLSILDLMFNHGSKSIEILKN
tara:strand:+ start:719 stop:1402 length:684 start_codon:yes stop_codon:yes gene_type:complete